MCSFFIDSKLMRNSAKDCDSKERDPVLGILGMMQTSFFLSLSSIVPFFFKFLMISSKKAVLRTYCHRE